MSKATYAGSISGAGAQVVPPVFKTTAPPKGKVNTARSGQAGR